MDTSMPRTLRLHVHGRGRSRALAVLGGASMAAVACVGVPSPGHTGPLAFAALAAGSTVPDVVEVPQDGAAEDAVVTMTGGDWDQSVDEQLAETVPLDLPVVMGTSGIPERVLAAYQAAGSRIAEENPGCGLQWWVLAGIGRVESGHAAGGRVDENGRTLGEILGPRLDGSLEGTAVIGDSDGGLLDGDRDYDRAVGPMQFLPGTWAGYGVDADGDGAADPHDVDDATYAAARYLCAGGDDLGTDAGLTAAILRYNRSAPYVERVLAYGRGYSLAVVPVAADSGVVQAAAVPQFSEPFPSTFSSTTFPSMTSTTFPSSPTTPPPTTTVTPTEVPATSPTTTWTSTPSTTSSSTSSPSTSSPSTSSPSTSTPDTTTTTPSDTTTTTPSDTATTTPSDTATTTTPPTDEPSTTTSTTAAASTSTTTAPTTTTSTTSAPAPEPTSTETQTETPTETPTPTETATSEPAPEPTPTPSEPSPTEPTPTDTTPTDTTTDPQTCPAPDDAQVPPQDGTTETASDPCAPADAGTSAGAEAGSTASDAGTDAADPGATTAP